MPQIQKQLPATLQLVMDFCAEDDATIQAYIDKHINPYLAPIKKAIAATPGSSLRRCLQVENIEPESLRMLLRDAVKTMSVLFDTYGVAVPPIVLLHTETPEKYIAEHMGQYISSITPSYSDKKLAEVVRTPEAEAAQARFNEMRKDVHKGLRFQDEFPEERLKGFRNAAEPHIRIPGGALALYLIQLQAYRNLEKRSFYISFRSPQENINAILQASDQVWGEEAFHRIDMAIFPKRMVEDMREYVGSTSDNDHPSYAGNKIEIRGKTAGVYAAAVARAGSEESARRQLPQRVVELYDEIRETLLEVKRNRAQEEALPEVAHLVGGAKVEGKRGESIKNERN